MISRFLFSFTIFFLIWLGFTSTFDLTEMAAGAVLSFIISLFAFKSFSDQGMTFFSPKKIFFIFKYLFVFIIALLKSNFDVARRVINPKLPINPGIVKYKTKLKNNTAKTLLANSITLTPGTLTVDIVDDILYVHWIDVISNEPEIVYAEVGEQFEVILKEIYE